MTTTAKYLKSRVRHSLRSVLGNRRKPGKLRVLYIVSKYPEFSETYMHEEIASIWEACDVMIVNYMVAGAPRKTCFPHTYLPYKDVTPSYGDFSKVNLRFTSEGQREFLKDIDPIIRGFQPDVVHAHYLPNTLIANELAETYGVPYTIRTHSFDMLQKQPERRLAMCKLVRSKWCLKIFTFPAHVDFFLQNGVPRKKVAASWPVVNVDRFLNTEPRENTHRIVCAGPCVIKKAHAEFIDLAKTMRDRGMGFEFTLKSKGNLTSSIESYNEQQGSPVSISYSEPEDMPGVYRDHDWLIYPSDCNINEVGLPAAIVEAQASGIGVGWQELPGRRQEQLDFLGGAGFLFQSIDDVPGLVSEPYPEEMRLAGFENAKKCDVKRHKDVLMRVWSSQL